MWEEYAKDPAHALEWQQTYMNFMFDLEDSSGKSRKHVLIFQYVYIPCQLRARMTIIYYAFARRFQKY